MLWFFSVVVYGCESWTEKEAECWRSDDFELWCWRRLLRVSWAPRRSNQSIVKEVSPGVHWKDWCLCWNSKILATWCEEVNIWKDPDAGKDWGQTEGDNSGWDGWMVSLTQWTWVWVDSGSWWWTARPGVLKSMGSQRVEHNWVTNLNLASFQVFFHQLYDVFGEMSI